MKYTTPPYLIIKTKKLKTFVFASVFLRISINLKKIVKDSEFETMRY